MLGLSVDKSLYTHVKINTTERDLKMSDRLL